MRGACVEECPAKNLQPVLDLGARTIGEQTSYVVKLVFLRGDAASPLLGFCAEGKITAVSPVGMAWTDTKGARV